MTHRPVDIVPGKQLCELGHTVYFTKIVPAARADPVIDRFARREYIGRFLRVARREQGILHRVPSRTGWVMKKCPRQDTNRINIFPKQPRNEQ